MVTAETKAGVFGDIAIAVTIGKLALPSYENVGQGNVAADQRVAQHIRAAALAICEEVVEEMEMIAKT